MKGIMSHFMDVIMPKFNFCVRKQTVSITGSCCEQKQRPILKSEKVKEQELNVEAFQNQQIQT